MSAVNGLATCNECDCSVDAVKPVAGAWCWRSCAWSNGVLCFRAVLVLWWFVALS